VSFVRFHSHYAWTWGRFERDSELSLSLSLPSAPNLRYYDKRLRHLDRANGLPLTLRLRRFSHDFLSGLLFSPRTSTSRLHPPACLDQTRLRPRCLLSAFPCASPLDVAITPPCPNQPRQRPRAPRLPPATRPLSRPYWPTLLYLPTTRSSCPAQAHLHLRSAHLQPVTCPLSTRPACTSHLDVSTPPPYLNQFSFHNQLPRLQPGCPISSLHFPTRPPCPNHSSLQFQLPPATCPLSALRASFS
jgi:hypothetical protein